MFGLFDMECAGLLQALVQVMCQLFLVKVLADEDNLLHAVAVLFVPVAKQARLLLHQLDEVFFGRGGIPLSGLGKLLLHACLLKEVRHVAVVAEVAHTLGTDDVLRPAGSDEVIQLVDVEGRTAVVYKRADAVFFHFSAFVVVVVMVMMSFFFVLVFLVMVLFFMLVVVAAVGMCFALLFLRCGPFYFADPAG